MKTWLKVGIGLAIAGIIGAAVVYIFVYNKPHPDYETEKADFRLEAKDLYSEFKSDETTAGQKYNGKVIEISGIPTAIEEADSMLIVAFAFEEGMFGSEGIRVTMLPKFSNQLKENSTGESVTLKGYLTGFNGTDVILEKGSIVK
jgi:hypothetical protein